MSLDLLHETEELLSPETERADPEAESETVASEPISRFGLLSEELSGGAGAMYLREIAHHELLTAQEEVSLAQRLATGMQLDLDFTNGRVRSTSMTAVEPVAIQNAPIGTLRARRARSPRPPKSNIQRSRTRPTRAILYCRTARGKARRREANAMVTRRSAGRTAPMTYPPAQALRCRGPKIQHVGGLAQLRADPKLF